MERHRIDGLALAGISCILLAGLCVWVISIPVYCTVTMTALGWAIAIGWVAVSIGGIGFSMIMSREEKDK